MSTTPEAPAVKPAVQPASSQVENGESEKSSPAVEVKTEEVPTPPSVVPAAPPAPPAPPSAVASTVAAQPPSSAKAFAAVPPGNVEDDTITRDPYVDLSALVNAGRIEDTVHVFDYQIRMHTLRADENTEALAAVGHMGDTAGANALMVQVLSRAMDTVNGIALEDIYQGNQQSRIAKRVELVSAFQQTFLTRLWEQYTNLMDRSTAIAEEAEGPLKNL